MAGSKRVHVSVFMAIDGVGGARSLNMSMDGAFIATSDRPEIGTLHEVSMQWGDTTARFQGRVVRHTPEGVAVTFEGYNTQAERALTELLWEGDDVITTNLTKP